LLQEPCQKKRLSECYVLAHLKTTEYSHSDARTINSLLDITNNDEITEHTIMVRVIKATSKVISKLISQSNKGTNKVTTHVS
jgi:hypothetical protein